MIIGELVEQTWQFVLEIHDSSLRIVATRAPDRNPQLGRWRRSARHTTHQRCWGRLNSRSPEPLWARPPTMQWVRSITSSHYPVGLGGSTRK